MQWILNNKCLMRWSKAKTKVSSGPPTCLRGKERPLQLVGFSRWWKSGHCPDHICKMLDFSFLNYFSLFVNHMQTISLNCPVLHALGIISCQFGVNISLFSVSCQVHIPLFSLIVPGSHQGFFILFPSYITILEPKQLTRPKSSWRSPNNGTK